MKATAKLIALFLLLAGFIYESSFLYIDNLPFHLVCLAVMTIACLMRFGKTKLIHELRLFLPFVFTMLSVYVLMGLLKIKILSSNSTDNSLLLYWVKYGINRTALFINTLFVMQLLMSYISIFDILSLPMHISKKRYLLLGRALFIHSIKYVEELEFHLRLLPEFQRKKLTFKQWFRFKLQLSLAIILMILRESKLKGEFIDNRIIHCFKIDKRSTS